MMPNDTTLPEMQKKGIILRESSFLHQALKWKVELLIKKNVYKKEETKIAFFHNFLVGIL